jgi:hypothetical protein
MRSVSGRFFFSGVDDAPREKKREEGSGKWEAGPAKAEEIDHRREWRTWTERKYDESASI